MQVRKMQLSAKHLRRHPLMRSERVEPRQKADLDAPPLRLLEEVGGFGSDHRLEPTQEPCVGDTVEIAVVIEHLGGWDLQSISNVVQAHSRPLAVLFGEIQRGIQDRRAQVPGGVPSVDESWGVALRHDPAPRGCCALPCIILRTGRRVLMLAMLATASRASMGRLLGNLARVAALHPSQARRLAQNPLLPWPCKS